MIVRDLIHQSARLAGLTDTFEDLSSDESSLMLTYLNNIINQYNLQSYFPYKIITNTVTETINSSKITIGKNLLYGIGEQEIDKDIVFTTKLVNGYTTGSSTSIIFDSVKDNNILINGAYHIVLGKATGVNGGILTFVNGIVDSWNNVDIGLNEDITFTYHTVNSQDGFIVDSVNGIYENVDVFIEMPNEISAVINNSVSAPYPLKEVSYTDYVNYGYNPSTDNPSKYAYNMSYPIAEINIFPNTNARNFIISSKYIREDFDYNDTFNYPPAYNGVILYGLAKMLAVVYGYFEKMPYLDKLENDALRNIKKLNSGRRMLRSNPIGKNSYFGATGGYDINSDKNY